MKVIFFYKRVAFQNAACATYGQTLALHKGIVRGLELCTHSYLLLSLLLLSEDKPESELSDLAKKNQQLFLIVSTFTLMLKELKPALDESLQSYINRFATRPELKTLFKGVSVIYGVLSLSQALYSILTLNLQGFLQGAYGFLGLTTGFHERMANVVEQVLEERNYSPVAIPYALGATRLMLSRGVPALIDHVVPDTSSGHPLLPAANAERTELARSEFEKSVKEMIQDYCKKNPNIHCVFNVDTEGPVLINIATTHAPSLEIENTHHLEPVITKFIQAVSEHVGNEGKVGVYMEGVAFKDTGTWSLEDIANGITRTYPKFEKFPSNVVYMAGEQMTFKEAIEIGPIKSEYIKNHNLLADSFDTTLNHNGTSSQCHTHKGCYDNLGLSIDLLRFFIHHVPKSDRDWALYQNLFQRHATEKNIIFFNIRGSAHFAYDPRYFSSDPTPSSVIVLSNSGLTESPYLFRLTPYEKYRKLKINLALAARAVPLEKLSSFEEFRTYFNQQFRPVAPDQYDLKLMTVLQHESIQKIKECYDV